MSITVIEQWCQGLAQKCYAIVKISLVLFWLYDSLKLFLLTPVGIFLIQCNITGWLYLWDNQIGCAIPSRFVQISHILTSIKHSCCDNLTKAPVIVQAHRCLMPFIFFQQGSVRSLLLRGECLGVCHQISTDFLHSSDVLLMKCCC